MDEAPDKRARDEELVKSFQSGVAAAFDSLVRNYERRTFVICLRYLGNEEDAREIAQEIFVRAYRALGGFRFECSFSTWLNRITINACINEGKSLFSRIKKRFLKIDSDGEDDERPIQLADHTPIAPELMASLETTKRIEAAIAELEPNHRMAIVLRDIEELSYEEIADVVGVKVGTVKSRIARAREELRIKLKDLR